MSTFVLASVLGAAPGAVLPLRKLRLYETGVGYYERRGGMRGGKDLALPLPASHLDDALKSLVVLEASGSVKIEGLQFGSAVSEGMARAMAGLPEAAGEALGYDDLLNSLEGVRVEVRPNSGGRVRGRLVDVEGPFHRRVASNRPDADAAPPSAEPSTDPYYTLLVFDEDEAVRRIDTDDVESIKVLDDGAAKRLDVAAAALSGRSARSRQEVKIQADGAGELGLGYIAESPVWRTTYRVVLGNSAETGQLQAWALVHNDTDEDWRNVSLEMVNGRPASFLHPLAAPRYARRDLVEPQDDLSTVPQLANTTVDRMWLDGEVIGESFGVGGLGLTGVGRGGGGTGQGTIGMGTVGTIGADGFGDLATLSQAGGAESGALFIYRVEDPVDLDAHHSALLPISQTAIEAESITWFGKSETEGLSAVRIVNSTPQTLPAGAISFFADGGFVGESMLDRLKPKERRFIAHGRELDVDLRRHRTSMGETQIGLEYANDEIRERYALQSKIALHVHNRSGRAKRTYVGLDLPRRAELVAQAGLELDFDLETNTPLAIVQVAAGAQVRTTVEAKTSGHRVLTVSTEALEQLLSRKGVQPTDRETLKSALTELRKVRTAARRAEELEQEIAELNTDLQRLRKNLGALGAAEARGVLRDRMTRQLLRAENNVSAKQRQRRAQERVVRKANEQARAFLSQLGASK